MATLYRYTCHLERGFYDYTVEEKIKKVIEDKLTLQDYEFCSGHDNYSTPITRQDLAFHFDSYKHLDDSKLEILAKLVKKEFEVKYKMRREYLAVVITLEEEEELEEEQTNLFGGLAEPGIAPVC